MFLATVVPLRFASHEQGVVMWKISLKLNVSPSLNKVTYLILSYKAQEVEKLENQQTGRDIIHHISNINNITCDSKQGT